MARPWVSRGAQAEALTQREGWVAQSLPAPESHPSPAIGNIPLSEAWQPPQGRGHRKLLLGGITLSRIQYPDCSLRKMLAGRERGTGLARVRRVQWERAYRLWANPRLWIWRLRLSLPRPCLHLALTPHDSLCVRGSPASLGCWDSCPMLTRPSTSKPTPLFLHFLDIFSSALKSPYSSRATL